MSVDRKESVASFDVEAQNNQNNGEGRAYVFGRPQREIIIEDNFQAVVDIRIHEQYQKKKLAYFSVCTLCNFAGIMLMVYALAVTNEFAGKSDEINYPLLGVSIALFVPFFVWLKVIFWPGKLERIRRYNILGRWRKRTDLETTRRDYFNGDLFEEEKEELDAYGMKVGAGSGAPINMSKGALARAGAAALNDKKKSDNAANKASGSKRSSFMDGLRGKKPDSNATSNKDKPPGGTSSLKKKEVLSARDQLLLDLNIPKIGGHRLNDVNRNDPAMMAIIMPRKSKAHIRVVPDVPDPWECSKLVAVNKRKGDDIPYHAAITALSEQKKHRQSHYLIETPQTDSAAVESNLANIDLMHESFSGKERKKGGNKTILPPVMNSRGNYETRKVAGGTKASAVGKKSINFGGGGGGSGGGQNKRVSFKG